MPQEFAVLAIRTAVRKGEAVELNWDIKSEIPIRLRRGDFGVDNSVREGRNILRAEISVDRVKAQ